MSVFSGPEVVNNGLVLNLDAASTRSYPKTGTVWNDLSGNGNHGTLVNGATYNSDNSGSLMLDGTNDYVSVASSSSFNFASNDFSVECAAFFDSSTSTDDAYRYVFTVGDTTNYLLLAKWRSGISNGLFLDYSVSGNRYTMTTSNNVPSPNVNNTITSPLYDVPNKWSFFSIIAQSNVLIFYINGVSYGSVAMGSRWNQNQELNIGYLLSGGYMKGKIPFFRVYKNKALTAAEVEQNFEAMRGRYGI